MTPDFETNPLIPSIVQDSDGGGVRMLGYMDREAFERTKATGELHFHSRSRGRLWKKGETSGNVHRVVGLEGDCDGDALLVLVEPAGPTCHSGSASCFDGESGGILARLERVISSRLREGSESSYTATLVRSGVGRVAQKVGEEGVETALAGVSGNGDAVVSESADLIYHLMVLWASRGVTLADVLAELRRRMEKKP